MVAGYSQFLGGRSRACEIGSNELLNVNQIDVRALSWDVHVGRASVGKRHITGEDDIFTVTADGGARLRPVALSAARSGMGEPIDRAGIDLSEDDFVLVELPIAARWDLIIRVACKKLRPGRARIEEGE